MAENDAKVPDRWALLLSSRRETGYLLELLEQANPRPGFRFLRDQLAHQARQLHESISPEAEPVEVDQVEPPPPHPMYVQFRELSDREKDDVLGSILFDYIDGGRIAEVLELVVEVEKAVR